MAGGGGCCGTSNRGFPLHGFDIGLICGGVNGFSKGPKKMMGHRRIMGTLVDAVAGG